MQLAYPQNDTRAETLRYLGAGGWQPDAASQVLLQKAEDALRAAATPRGVWKQLPLTALPLQNAGNDIARHLRGCDAMVLMAVTLGSGADTLMRRLELTVDGVHFNSRSARLIGEAVDGFIAQKCGS